MSKWRKEPLLGEGLWGCFYDKEIQRVLMQRFSVPALNDPTLESVKLEFLAWPILAFRILDDFAQERRTKVERHANGVVHAYAEDRQFVSGLLSAITRYHQTPEKGKRLTRRIAELSCVADTGSHLLADERRLPDRLLDWKTIAQMLDCKNSVDQLMIEHSREQKRRLALTKKWSAHFASYEELSAQRWKKKTAMLPLQNVSFE